MKHAVVTVTYGDDFKELSTVTHPTIKAYADKIQADFIVLDDLGNHLYPHFIKFDLANLLKSYDRILYVDSDIVIREDSPNIFDIVPMDKLGILSENPCQERDGYFKTFLQDLGCFRPWDGSYYNTGVMVLSKFHSNLFNLWGEEIFQYGEQSYINYNIVNFKPAIHPLNWRFNRMNAHNEETKQWRFSAYFMHYAAYLTPPNTVDVVKDLIIKDLEIWEKHKPNYAFPKNNSPDNGRHQEYTEVQNEYLDLSSIMVEDRTIYFRNGTSDSLIINKNLTQNDKPEYTFPILPIQPKVVLDIGGNIGITSLLLNKRYPEAKIYTFEPEQQNFFILEKNVRGINNIEIFNFGLSNSDQKVMLKSPSDPINFGGFSVFDKGVDGDHQEIELKSISGFMEQKGIQNIDVIKVDCEGAEHDILTSMDLSNVTWIEGECHGIKDFELLAYINKTHVLTIDKPGFQRNFGFKALNKLYVSDKSY